MKQQAPRLRGAFPSKNSRGTGLTQLQVSAYYGFVMEGNQAGIADFSRLFPVLSATFAHISAHNTGITYHRMRGPEGKLKRFLRYATVSSIEFHLKWFLTRSMKRF
jgi:hypothetical protein